MKKNGFIATSLIYTFFLIFITLFLTIIGDYLQNKILLDTTEEGIKDGLNSSINVSYLNVGDVIYFVSDCNNIDENTNNAYIVANVNNKGEVVLYSYVLTDVTSCALRVNDLYEDLALTGNLNSTNLKRVLYTYDTTLNTFYSLRNLDGSSDANLNVYKYYDGNCSSNPSEYNISKTEGCLVEGKTNYYRQRLTWEGNGETKCPGIDSAMGGYFVKDSVPTSCN